MQQASSQMLALLSANVRVPVVEVIVIQANPANRLQTGSYHMLDGVLEIAMEHNEEHSTDTLRINLANDDGRYSPYQGTPLST